MADEQQKPPETPATTQPTSQSEGSAPLSQVRSRIDKLEQNMRSNSMSGGTSQQQLDENAKQRSALVYEFLLQAKTINSMMGSVDYISARKEAERLIGLSKQFPGSPMLSGQVSGTMQDIMSKSGGTAASGSIPSGGAAASGSIPSGGGTAAGSGGGGYSGVGRQVGGQVGEVGGPIGSSAGAIVGAGVGKGLQGQVYQSFLNAGFSQKQSVALTAEVGRENDYNPNHVFGSHRDSGRDNYGFFSWNQSRGQAVNRYLKENNALTPDGRIKRDQHSLDVMANFTKREIQTKYPKTAKEFLGNPNIDYHQAAKILGSDYIRWDMAGHRINASQHAAKRDNYRTRLLNNISGGGEKAGKAPSDTTTVGSKKETSSSGYRGNNYLASTRKKFFDELDRDPQLKRDVIKTASMEGKILPNIEQMSNYAQMRGFSSLRQAIHSGFYGPVNRGGLKGGLNQNQLAEGEKAITAARSGSNLIDYRTDQGLWSDPNGAWYRQHPDQARHANVGGANFFDFRGKGPQWAQQQREAAARFHGGQQPTTQAGTTPQTQKDATRTASNIPIVTPESSVLKTQMQDSRGQKSYGSAFSIGGGYYMTAAHTMSREGSIDVIKGRTKADAELIHKDTNLDYAILKTSEAGTSKLQQAGMTNIGLSPEAPKEGSRLTFQGYSGPTGKFTTASGKYSGEEDFTMKYDNQISTVKDALKINTEENMGYLRQRMPGTSGGPVTNKGGEAVGLVSGHGARGIDDDLTRSRGEQPSMFSPSMARILKDIPKGTIPQNVLDAAIIKQKEQQAAPSGGTTTYFGPGTPPQQPQTTTHDIQKQLETEEKTVKQGLEQRIQQQSQGGATPEQKQAPIPQPGAAPLYEGKTGRRLPGKSLIGVNPELASRLQAAYAAAPASARKGFSVISAVRDTKLQAKLYERYRASGFDPSHIAAKPGHSMHETGQAVDIKDPSGWFHKHGPEFGVYPPMGKKDWPHMQLMPGRTPLHGQAVKPTIYKPDTKTTQIRQAAVKKESKRTPEVQHHHHPQQHSSEERNKVPATSQHISEHKNNWAKAHHSQAATSSAVHSSLHTPREKQHASLGADIGTA